MQKVPDLGLEADIRRVEECIEENIQSDERLLTEIATYVIESGGKRLRPAMILLAYKSVGATEMRPAVELAAAFELIHSATLIHDDINDGGTMRRGRPAAYKQYGILNALVTGDFLFTRAFGIGGRFGKKVVAITVDTCSGLAEGEIRQKRNIGNVGLTREEYLAIVKRKTAGPIAAGGRIGALVGGGSSGQVEALGVCGLNLGIAFQMMDDILDVTGNPRVLGKGKGSDIREGNLTLLTIHALNDAPPAERVELARILQSTHKSPEDVERASGIIADSGAIQAVAEEARRFGSRALSAVEARDDLLYIEDLRELVTFVLTRDH